VLTAKATGNTTGYHDPKLFDHSALMLATIGGNLLIIELLLNWGANVEIKNSKGFTACDYAQQKPQHDVNELLSTSSTKLRR
jgi:ankyrin repeat protein